MANWDGTLNNGAFLRLGVDQVSQDVNGNYSTDSWVLILSRGSNTSSWTGNGVQWNVNVGGNQYSGTFAFDFRNAESVVIASGSVNIGHNSDGTKQIQVSASIGATGTAVGGPTSASGAFNQTTIARASTPRFTSGAIVDAGQTIWIATDRASGSFTHDVDYFFGSKSGRAMTNITDSGGWVIPMSLLNEMKNSGIGYGTLRLYTYNGGALVGSKDVAFGIAAGSTVVPVIGTVTATEAVTAVSTKIGAFVQNASKLAIAMTGVAGAYGSTIKTYKLEVAGQVINAVSGTTPNVITASGTVAVKATVTDSRGKVTTKTLNITVLAYQPPKITSATFQRALSTGAVAEEGTYLRTGLIASVSSLLVGSTQKNDINVRVSTRARGATTWTVKSNNLMPGLTYNSYILNTSYAITSAWEVLIEVYDELTTSAIQGALPTAKVVMHWGGQGEGAGIGKFWERGGLDVLSSIYHRDGGMVDPPGIIQAYAGATAPAGWRICDGGAISRTTYPDLFAIIGTTYGAGDGTTTFNVPNLKGRVPVGIDTAQTEFDVRGETGGAKTHTLTTAQLAAHAHSEIIIDGSTSLKWNTAAAQSGSGAGVLTSSGGTNTVSTGAAGSGAAHNNLQPYMAMHYIIKY